MFESWKRIVAVVGHYGTGKTNLAVNLALHHRRAGKEVALVDLDIVNPYFRSADFADEMEREGIETVVPLYARSNLDIPALTARLDAIIDTDKTLIIDVGGDDAGAAALGRYSRLIETVGGCELLYVVNRYRYLTQTAEEAEAVLADIEAVAHLKATGVVNCSNLGDITTPNDIEGSMSFARQTADRHGIPLAFTVADSRIYEQTRALLPSGDMLYPVQIYVKKIWEK